MKPYLETVYLFIVALFIGYGVYWFATFNVPTVSQMDEVIKLYENDIPVYRMDGIVEDGELKIVRKEAVR